MGLQVGLKRRNIWFCPNQTLLLLILTLLFKKCLNGKMNMVRRYLLVSKECRNIGVGRALINCFVEYCHAHGIDNCFLWPDGETAEKIYYEAGFRHVETKQAGRAIKKETVKQHT
uniref:GNAT family N-acetyltransferase n=1 Tax=Acetatifactor sp. TaxID=1872090 RepID=UPI004056B8F5